MSHQRRKEKSKSKQKPALRTSSFTKSIFVSSLAIGAIAACYYYYTTYYGTTDAPATSYPDWKHDEMNRDAAIFTVVDLPGKGKGAIAARDILQGEVVLTEKPLFVVPLRINSSPTALISSKLKALSPTQRESFYNLSYVSFPPHLDPNEYPDQVALAIFQTNAVSAGKDGVGIFPRMARLNHGCSSAFNVVYSWREEEELLYVHALKSIPKGRELLTTYTDSKRPRDERRAYLSQQYGFHCTCDVCSLPDALSKASDDRLSAISAHYGAFATWGTSQIDGREALDHIRTIWRLGEEEGYWSERGQLAADAAWVAAAHSDAHATQAWAQLAVEWYSYEIGGDAPQAGAMRAVAARPQTHTAWGTRAALGVGGPESTGALNSVASK